MSKTNETVTIKEYEKLVYSDDFMFRKTMEDLSLCHDVVECLLQRPVAEFNVGQTEKEYALIHSSWGLVHTPSERGAMKIPDLFWETEPRSISTTVHTRATTYLRV